MYFLLFFYLFFKDIDYLLFQELIIRLKGFLVLQERFDLIYCCIKQFRDNS